MKKRKAFIYCRAMDGPFDGIVDYQINSLKELSAILDFEIISVGPDRNCSGKNFYPEHIKKLLLYIGTHKIDTLVVYDMTRISVFEDVRAEFTLYCKMHNVEILTYKEIRQMVDEKEKSK